MRRVLTALIVAPLLAGCLAAAPGDGTVPSVLPFRTCEEASGRFPIPLDDARASVPEGFEPVLGGPQGDQALLFLTAFACRITAADGSDETVTEVQSMVVVDPPAEYALTGDGFRSHGFLVDWVTSSATAAAFYDPWSVPYHQDDVSLSFPLDTPAARQGTVETRTADGALRLDTAVRGEAQPFGGGTVRLFYGSGDRLYHVDVQWDGIPNTMAGGGALQHPRFGAVASADVFHAWPYAWNMTFEEIGGL